MRSFEVWSELTPVVCVAGLDCGCGGGRAGGATMILLAGGDATDFTEAAVSVDLDPLS